MKNIKCRNCFFYRNEWYEKIVDSPDPEEARDCNYFRDMTNADRIRVMSDMELAQWMASRIANLKFLDIEMSGKQLTAAEKAALTHDLYVVFGRYLQQPAEEDKHEAN